MIINNITLKTHDHIAKKHQLQHIICVYKNLLHYNWVLESSFAAEKARNLN